MYHQQPTPDNRLIAPDVARGKRERDAMEILDEILDKLHRIADRFECSTDGVEDAADRLATAFNDAKMRIVELEAALSYEQLTAAHYGADLVTIVQLCGGDVEDGPAAARECVERVLAQAKAPHVRDDRRLGLIDGWEFDDSSAITTWFRKGANKNIDAVIRLFKDARWHVIAWHADKSFTQHRTLLEAHDALIASGSESPFVVVTGPAVAKAEGGAA